MFKRNVLANFFGKVWPSLLGILLVPIYLYYLGVEAYGLIGFFVSLQALIGFLDLGLSTTTNREVAMKLNAWEQGNGMHDLIRTFEVIYGLVSVVIAVGFFLASDWLATEWINIQNLSVDTARYSVIIFGISLALRWPVALYSGILQGSERQVLYNGLNAGISTLRGAGGALVVVFLSRTILAYFIWQLVAALLELLVMALVAWKVLRPNRIRQPRVDFSTLRDVWRFSASVGANSLLAALIKQLDRILISKLLLLQQVGYYSTANTVYSAVSLVTSPFASAAFPRFTALIAEKNDAGLAALYHKTSQHVSFIVAPISAILMFFSHDILLLWTRSEEVAANASTTLSILAIAALFNSMMHLPFMLQLAAGITWIGLWTNIAGLMLIAPVMFTLIGYYGAAGAGIAWVLYNILYYLIVPHVMHRYILTNEKPIWYLGDTASFILLSLLIFGAAYWFALDVETAYIRIVYVFTACLVYCSVCAVSFRMIRESTRDILFGNANIKRISADEDKELLTSKGNHPL